ncbi:unnamed protein product [Nesidiocoris tenuis]|uniref:Uncharacterized protein n=1 Tax=Nesidiocoris tenuis TaxID=355587 RepID=A0A6H5GZZ4_9HEMI|nr:unnamed protein product [Nesidiocoris tenuis]
MEGRSPRLSERSHSRPPMDRTASNRSSSVTHDHHHAASGPSSITQHTAASLSKSKATSQSGQRPVAAQRVASAPAAARRSLPAKPSAPAPTTSSQPARNITTPQPSASSLPRPRVNPKFSQVKPRYLEPKPPRKDLDSVVVNGSGGRRLSGGGRPLSSSDSSRTSSPAANRVARSRPSTAGSNKSKTPLGSGSGGNPSPSSVSSAGTGGNSSKISRNMTFRVATKSSQAKVQSPRQLSARHPHIAQRDVVYAK